jgi:putative tryptophan/tyrosine transport system substrate-binding protein
VPTRRRLIGAVAGLLAGAGAAPRAGAQATVDGWPSRSVRAISPTGSGGPGQNFRLYADALKDAFGQSFVLENMPGGSGAIGCMAVARAAADGQTLLLASNSHIVLAPLVRTGMQDLGWGEGHNIRFDIRFSDGDAERARAYAAEIVAAAPDAILANTAPVVAGLQQRTRTIPIVFVQVLDPVSSGFVDSLARPGGNITGFSSYDFGLGAKWLELLKDVAPGVTRVGVLRDPSIRGGSGLLGAMQAVASAFKVELVAIDVREAAAIERGVAAFAQGSDRGLIIAANPGAIVHLDLIVALAARNRLPAVYPYRFFATRGGLISYGSDNLDEWRKAATYMDRILKGESPAVLPVQQLTRYELVINLKTAKALGLTVPETLLARADEVIE